METIVICEKNEHIIANYIVLLTHPYSKLVVQLIVNYITTKQSLTCSNRGKTSHAQKTYHNMKGEEHVIPFVPTKVVEPVVKIIAQPIKLAKVPLRYPFMICYSSKHRALANPRKMKIQKMFRTKPTTTSIVIPTTSRLDNVPITVFTTVTTHNRIPKQ